VKVAIHDTITSKSTKGVKFPLLSQREHQEQNKYFCALCGVLLHPEVTTSAKSTTISVKCSYFLFQNLQNIIYFQTVQKPPTVF
jgi:hypothetical protein